MELAPAASNVIAPVTFVFGSIGPYLDTEPVPDISVNFQLAFVNGSVRINNFFSELKTFFIEEEI